MNLGGGAKIFSNVSPLTYSEFGQTGHCWTNATPSVYQSPILSNPWTWTLRDLVPKRFKKFISTSAPNGTTIVSPGLKKIWKSWKVTSFYIFPLIETILTCKPLNWFTSCNAKSRSSVITFDALHADVRVLFNLIHFCYNKKFPKFKSNTFQACREGE